ncbi:hypothetical protein Tco_1140766 [Tanacetum coccineum]
MIFLVLPPGRARPPAPNRLAPVTDQLENKDPPSSASTSPSSSSSDSPLRATMKETKGCLSKHFNVEIYMSMWIGYLNDGTPI